MYYSNITGGFFDATVCHVPSDAIEISKELHAALLEGQSQGKIIAADDQGYPYLADPPAPTVAELNTRTLSAINAACETEIAAIQAAYPASEVLSWPKQEAEARAYAADPAAATPLLDALAEARGIDKATLAERVILKADAFARLSGAAIGKRQALEDALNALPEDATPEQIAAIVW